MNEGFLGSSPLAKESKNLPGNRTGRNGQPPGEIMKKQLTVPPVREQAGGPSQLDPGPHSVRLAQDAAETALELLTRLSTYSVVIPRLRSFALFATLIFCDSWDLSFVVFLARFFSFLPLLFTPFWRHRTLLWDPKL